MTNSEQNSLVVEPTTEVIEHKFQQLNLQEIGLQQDDFNAVLAARKELAKSTITPWRSMVKILRHKLLDILMSC